VIDTWHVCKVRPQVRMEDYFYQQILNYYTSFERKYPQRIYDLDPAKRANVKSQFRQSVKPYRVDNGVVFHGDKETLVKSKVASVLKACHDNPASGGHFGRDKTLGKISQRYYWKGMKNDIRRYVNNCAKCFAVNPNVSNDSPPLNSIQVPSKVWSLCGIDIIGPLQETSDGKKYIVAITDHFSRLQLYQIKVLTQSLSFCTL